MVSTAVQSIALLIGAWLAAFAGWVVGRSFVDMWGVLALRLE
jgi:hypothetical protein